LRAAVAKKVTLSMTPGMSKPSASLMALPPLRLSIADSSVLRERRICAHRSRMSARAAGVARDHFGKA
jgi:hypothetical protein